MGFSGDGSPATSAALNDPWGLAVDVSGNVFIADAGNERIRKISAGGMISTYAGGGISGLGDGGPATAADLGNPWGLVVDSSGNLFMAEVNNSRIRKVNPGGIITTIAGGGPAGLGNGSQATSGQIYFPSGIAMDNGGNMYIADLDNQLVRKVSPLGIISTIAGNGTYGYSGDSGPATLAQLKDPSGVAVDGRGNVYFADANNFCIRKVSPAGIITTIAGNGTQGYSGDGGPATAARLVGPTGISINRGGNIYFADYGSERIRKIDTFGIITTVAGNGGAGYSGDGGQATDAELNGAISITADNANNLYISDFYNNVIRKVSTTGLINTIAGNGSYGGALGDGGAATAAELFGPNGVAIDSDGNVFIADENNGRIRMINTSGIISSFAGGGTTGLGDGGLATSASVSPNGVLLDNSGNLLICEPSSRIRKVYSGSILLQPISGAMYVCAFDSITLVDSTPGGTWISTNTYLARVSATGVVEGLSIGTVNIQYLVTNPCGSDTATYPVTVCFPIACTSGTNNLKTVPPELSVFPNPNTGSFTLYLTSATKEDARITISNVLGSKIQQQTVTPGKETEINLNVPAGVYFLSATIEGMKITKQLLIE